MGLYVAFVFTRWANYGAQEHSYWTSNEYWSLSDRSYKTPVEFVPRSIKNAAENDKLFNFEPLLSPEVEAELHSKWLEGRDIRFWTPWPPDFQWKPLKAIAPEPRNEPQH
jgi:hypothetical protein